MRSTAPVVVLFLLVLSQGLRAQELPLVFVQNRGQHPAEARFVARGPGLSAFFVEGGARLVLEDGAGQASALFLSLEGGAPVQPVARGEPVSRVHSYRGRDPSRWVTDAAAHEGLAYPDLAEGVELRFVGRDGRLSYDLVLAPGADPAGLTLRCEGALGLEPTAAGGLIVHTPVGPLRQSAPVAWERDAAGVEHPVSARFVVIDQERWRFDVPRRHGARELTIDPGLTWSSQLGGSLADSAGGVALTPEGHVVVVGTTGSANFPVSAGAIQGDIVGFNDAFVARIDPSDGRLVFATYFGGNDGIIFRPDVAHAVQVGADGFLYVAGTSASPDFPTTTGAAQEQSTGGTDGFVLRLHPGGFLMWSSLVGGAGNDEAMDLAVDAAGAVTVVGLTFSGDFPTTAGAFDESFNSLAFTDDGWVARLAPGGGSLAWSTLLGGALRDELTAVALDAQGRPVVVGLSGSSNLPTTAGAYDESFNGDGASETDALVARLAADGASLDWCTYLGSLELTEARDLALAADGDVVLVGETRGADFPVTPDAVQGSYGGGSRDGFVTRMEADGSALVWSTFLGGAADDVLAAVALTSGEQATVVGSSGSAALITALLPSVSPAGSGVTTGASGALLQGGAPGPLVPGGPTPTPSPEPFDAILGGTRDGLLARFASDGERLLAISFYGGGASDEVTDLALDEVGAAVFVGLTDSADLPLVGPPVVDGPQGAQDAFVARAELPPLSWLATGSASAGALALGARGAFEPGTPWSIQVTGARPGGRVWLLAGPPAAPGQLSAGQLAPSPVTLALSLPVDAEGRATLAGRSWPLVEGQALALQAWAPGSLGSGPVASPALQLLTP